jgi:hypothetical protein
MKKGKDEEKVRQAAGEVGRYVDASGWASSKDLIAFSLEHGIEHEFLHKAIRLLDRQKKITARKGLNQEEGWESLLGRGGARRYSGLSDPIIARMIFTTPPLGEVYGETQFTFRRDAEGKILFTPAQFRAMLHKAYRVSGLASDEAMTEAAINRIYVEFLGVAQNGKIHSEIRRPVNEQRKAVGELHHEALPAGSTAEWKLAFPTSHFNEVSITALLQSAQHVGFSPAGSGKMGGHRGLFSWDKLTKDG